MFGYDTALATIGPRGTAPRGASRRAAVSCEMGTKQNRVSVDRAEHEALCHLRDVEHEAVKLRLLAAEQRYQECLAINRDAVSRLARQDLEINGLRRELATLRAPHVEPAPAASGAP